MHKYIRWPGLIGFVVITALLALITFVFLDTWIKLAAKQGLQQTTGAEVNIASVSHTFSPFGVTLQEVQLTDPAKPSHNQMQAEQIKANIDLAPLLLNKVIIDDLVLTGVAFSQPRSSPGKVYRQPDEAAEQGSLPFLPKGIEVPEVDEILARSPLKTTKAVEEAQQAYDQHAAILKEKYAQLPSKDKLQAYKARVKALQETDYKTPADFAKAKQAFDELKADIQQDKQKITAFKQAVGSAKQALSPKLANLKAAPGEDYDQLQALVAGDHAAIQNVTRMVLGDKAAIWADYLLSAYQIAAPMLANKEEAQIEQARFEGRWIAFSDELPLPDFLIRNAQISVDWQNESFDSIWQDITHQHNKLGRPTTFSVDSAASGLWQALKLAGDIMLTKGGINANQSWDLVGVKLSDLPLLQEDKLTTQLEKALLASSGSLSVKDSLMDGSGKVNLTQLVMSAVGSNKLTNTIADAVKSLNNLNIDAALSGRFDRPDVDLSSDLDRLLGAALLNNLSPETQAKLDELKQKLNAKAAGPLDEKHGQMAQWLKWEELADGDLSRMEQMLSAQLSSILDKKKDEIKDKLTDKLFGKDK